MTEENTIPANREGRYAPRWRRVLTLAGATVAFLVVGVVTAFYGSLAAFMSDTCGPDDTAPICTGIGQNLTVVSPWMALTIGILLTTVGGGVAVWRRRSLTLWLLSAWALLFLGLLVSWSIAYWDV
ncbi:hypothetical protein FHX37_3224 [Haloactinospora alba]|uniref:Uncharacterized protein n=1 Tax=Haloactinospora alba TaxID=405555 RepID=A0A543NN09_9ACTN|nr:hypothetical protein [Haloactinospora alba]TQN33219.1 hypothetical protein FHX37_3224 [Haloactinospora alba]